MIKIVKPGETIFTMRCPQCGCVYTYELKDIIGISIHCPNCDYPNPHYARINNDALSNTVDINTDKIKHQG